MILHRLFMKSGGGGDMFDVVLPVHAGCNGGRDPRRKTRCGVSLGDLEFHDSS